MLLSLLCACSSTQSAGDPSETIAPTRSNAIPSDAIKHGPEDDAHAPILHSDEWQSPMPMSGPINTAGAEDSPFISPDGQLFFFFFTPDVRIPAERQIVDGVTGIYVSKRVSGEWSEPTRVLLQDHGSLAMDGCAFYQEGELWFCTIREGLLREIDIWQADFDGREASNWHSAGEELNLEVGLGEFHFSSDWNTVYFHSDRESGSGGIDLWVSRRQGEGWSTPQNLSALNTPDHDGWPFLTTDGSELWFTRTYQGTPGIFRSRWSEGGWSDPELILSQFAGEPTLDADGNLYFVHHYFRDGTMLEADIYVAYRR